MSRTIESIQRHVIPESKAASIPLRTSTLVAEWQQRGPETLSGQTLRKLRLVFGPTHSVIAGSAAA